MKFQIGDKVVTKPGCGYTWGSGKKGTIIDTASTPSNPVYMVKHDGDPYTWNYNENDLELFERENDLFRRQK